MLLTALAKAYRLGKLVQSITTFNSKLSSGCACTYFWMPNIAVSYIPVPSPLFSILSLCLTIAPVIE